MYKITIEKIDINNIKEEHIKDHTNIIIEKMKKHGSVINCFHCSTDKINFYINIDNPERAIREATRIFPSCLNTKRRCV